MNPPKLCWNLTLQVSHEWLGAYNECKLFIQSIPTTKTSEDIRWTVSLGWASSG